MTYPQLVMHGPVNSFLPLLVDGWRLPDVVEPADVGGYGLLLWRPENARLRSLESDIGYQKSTLQRAADAVAEYGGQAP